MNMVKCGEKEFIAKFLEVYPKSYIVNQWVQEVYGIIFFLCCTGCNFLTLQ